MSNAISIGPIVLATSKAIVLVALVVFLLLLDKLNEKIDGLAKWSFRSVLIAFVGARFGDFILNFAYYQDDLLSVLYFWRPGYQVEFGLFLAVIYTIFVIYKYGFKTLVDDFKQKSKVILIVILLTFLTISAVLFAPIANQVNSENAPKLPDVELETLTGKKVNLADFKGENLIVNFWATWCPSCRREIPAFVQLSKITDTKIILINQGEDVLTVQNYLKSENLNFENILLDQTNQLSRIFEVKGLPTTLFFDKSANLRYANLGIISASDLSRLNKELTD